MNESTQESRQTNDIFMLRNMITKNNSAINFCKLTQDNYAEMFNDENLDSQSSWEILSEDESKFT